MNTAQRALALCVLAAGLAAAQPVIGTNGVVNGASFVPVPLPNSGIAQGSIFSIFGLRLSTVTKNVADEGFPLKTTSDGTTVEVTAGGTTRNAVLLFLSPGQINAIMPSNVPAGQASVVVNVNGTRSNAQAITVMARSVGLLARNQAGSGPGIIYNFVPPGSQPLNALTVAAHPSQVLILWGTGLGPYSGADNVAPNAGNIGDKPEVIVGGKRASVEYWGRAPGLAGLDQLNITLPGDVPTGCRVPVQVKTGTGAAAIVSNSVTIAVAPAGQNACQDPLSFGGQSAATYASGGRIGSINLSRISFRMPGLGEFSMDNGFADFSNYGADSLLASSGSYGVSSMNSCVAYTYRGESTDPTDPVVVPGLDAGNPLVLDLPGGGSKNMVATAGVKGVYSVPFDPLGGGFTPWLGPGNHTIRVPGGADVGAFNATLNVPNAVVWTNQDAITDVVRANGQLITWSGGDASDLILISGASDNNNVGAGFYCVVENRAPQQFTVPADILLALPATGPSDEDNGFMYVGGVSSATKPGVVITPKPQGLDLATFTYMFASMKETPFK